MFFMARNGKIGISLSTAYDLVLKTGKRSCRFDTWVSSRKTVTASGNVRFEGERTRDGHADRFWAACAAVEAAATYVNPNHIYAQLI